jgi:hypothetical protein
LSLFDHVGAAENSQSFLPQTSGNYRAPNQKIDYSVILRRDESAAEPKDHSSMALVVALFE